MTDLKAISENKTLIAIIGPTASGKTETAVELSRLIPAEVISADSRQIFKYMDIGTAKPTREELDAVKHHFIDIVEPDEYYSAGVFGKEAEIVAEGIFAFGKLPLVVGGSGLYIKALCEGLFEDVLIHEGKGEIRMELNSALEQKGIEFLYNELMSVDRESAEKYTDRNPRRIMRALEYYRLAGVKFSSAHANSINKPFNTIYYGIESKREKLYNRINTRAESMWKSGLIEETKSIINKGYSPSLNSLNTVGYKECLSFLDGKMTEKEALDKMKQATRNYAKRQMTWFRKIENVRWIEGSPQLIAKEIFNDFTKKNILYNVV